MALHKSQEITDMIEEVYEHETSLKNWDSSFIESVRNFYYEKGGISARIAYNWRSSYLDQTTGSGANGIPQYAKPYASLDASVSVDINEHVAVSFDAVNLNNRMNVLYIGTPAAPLQYQLNDRRYGIALRVTY